METVHKKEFVEVKYTGYTNGQVFDSNIEEDIKKIHPEAKPYKTIIVVGEGMLVPGFDRAIEGKEIGKEYKIEVKAREAFGERNREFVKTMPLKVFREKNVDPSPGMVLTFDNSLGKVIAVSGARVVTDFNHALAGKDLDYKFTIVRKVTDEKERAEALFEIVFKVVPEFEINDKIIVKGPKNMEVFVKVFSEQFKKLMGKELAFEEKKTEKKEEKKEHSDEEEISNKAN